MVVDLLNQFILEKAFHKKYPLKTRLPYIVLYETVIILLLALAIFLGINFFKQEMIIGIMLIIVGIILFVMLWLPFTYQFKKNRNLFLFSFIKKDIALLLHWISIVHFVCFISS